MHPFATVLSRMPLVGAAAKVHTASWLIERILGSSDIPGGNAFERVYPGDRVTPLFAARGATAGNSGDRRQARSASGPLRVKDRALQLQAEFGQFYRAIIDSTEDAIIVLSLDGTVQLWSQGAERMLGYAEDQVKHRTINFLATPEQLARGLSLQDAAWRIDRHRSWQSVKRHKDGSLMTVAIDSSPIRDATGQHRGAVWIMRALDNPPQGDRHGQI